MITLDHLSVRLGRSQALRSVTAELRDGMFVGLLGPPGSGKTVLLKAICGLIAPTNGAALVDGEALVASTAEKRARVGMVFQNDALFDSLTARENVAMPLERRGLAPAEIERRVSEALTTVGLAGATEKHPGVLSGGMRKRLGLARALAGKPHHLCLDDPTAGLDPVTAARMVRLIGQVHASTGGVVIVVGYEPALLAACSHFMVLRTGEMTAFGSAAEVRRVPQAIGLLGLPE